MEVGGLVVRFLGSGDAFGSGGHLQACISVHAEEAHLLLDCGAASLVAMQRQGVDPNSVDAVVLTHLHGDHFGGIPFLVLYGQFFRRQLPLLIAGPPGTRERVTQAMEVLFPGSSHIQRRFELHYVELAERTETRLIGPFSITAFEVLHPSGAPAYAVRLTGLGKAIAYSGDTAWSEALVDAVRAADLFICEAYSFAKPIQHHLSYTTLLQHRQKLDCQRLILTHLGADMLAHRAEVAEEIAEDGLWLVV